MHVIIFLLINLPHQHLHQHIIIPWPTVS